MKREIFDFEKPHFVGSGRGAAGHGDGFRRGKRQIGTYRARDGRRGLSRLLGRKVGTLILALVLILTAVTYGLVLYSPINIRIKKSEFFMLVLSGADTLAAANEQSEAVSAAGGAGYVYNDGQFRIVGFVYQNKADADKVLQRLTGDYPDAEVLPFCQKREKIKRFGSRSDEKKLKKLLEYPSALVREVLDLVYDLDSFESSESATCLKFDALKAVVARRKEGADELYSARQTEVGVRLTAEFYAEILAAMGQVGILGTDKRLSHNLKRLACEIVCKNYALREKLALYY